MDPALYFKIYGEGVDEQIILRYTKYAKPQYLHSSVKDHV